MAAAVAGQVRAARPPKTSSRSLQGAEAWCWSTRRANSRTALSGRTVSAASTSCTTAAAEGGQRLPDQLHSYKTELFRPLEESGTCKYRRSASSRMASMSCAALLGTASTRLSCAAPSTPSASAPAAHAAISSTTQTNSRLRHRRVGVGAASGDLRAFGAHAPGFCPGAVANVAPHPQFLRLPVRPPPGAGELESPLLLDSLTSHMPPPPSCFSASSCSSSASSSSSASASSKPSGGRTCCTSAAAAPGTTCSTTSCANNAFTFGLELSYLITPLAIKTHSFAAAAAAYNHSQQQGLADLAPLPAQPPRGHRTAFAALRLPAAAPFVLVAPPSPPDSLSDRDSYLSGSLSSGSLSGSESPSLDPGRRLPIFSRLSISDD